jgi:hypothetical protein
MAANRTQNLSLLFDYFTKVVSGSPQTKTSLAVQPLLTPKLGTSIGFQLSAVATAGGLNGNFLLYRSNDERPTSTVWCLVPASDINFATADPVGADIAGVFLVLENTKAYKYKLEFVSTAGTGEIQAIAYWEPKV